jgi:hypothetical protein
MVRMKDYPSECPTGTPLKNPPSNYFASKQRLYSISVQGTFTKNHNGNEVLWELDLSRPIKAPYGSGVALRIAKWLEPSLEYDLDASEPFMNAPMISTMSALGVYAKDEFVQEFKDEFSKSASNQGSLPTSNAPENVSFICTAIAHCNQSTSIDATPPTYGFVEDSTSMGLFIQISAGKHCKDNPGQVIQNYPRKKKAFCECLASVGSHPKRRGRGLYGVL